jgi:homoserine dehydrogenase
MNVEVQGDRLSVENRAIVQHESTTMQAHGAHLGTARRLRRLRVFLLGCGTVGGGVLEHLLRDTSHYELCGVLVRDSKRHLEAGLAKELIALDPIEALERILKTKTDVVVEALGGLEPAYRLTLGTLAAGKYYVTANTELMARCWETLEPYTVGPNSRLSYSAALGGTVPGVDFIQRLRSSNDVFTSREGVHRLAGLGAGRYRTATAVMADLVHVRQRLSAEDAE